MRDDIILIGPMCAGKSSVAIVLARKLSCLTYPVDRIKWYYRFKNKYDLALGTQILRTQGFEALLDYSEKFFSILELRALLDEFRGGVIEFGASHTYCPDRHRLDEMQLLLAPFRNVVLLLPSPVPERTIEVLTRRIRDRYTESQRSVDTIESYVAMNKKFVQDKSTATLAKHTVYTDGKSIEEVAAAVLDATLE